MTTRQYRLMKSPFTVLLLEDLAAGGANLVGEPQWHDVIALACHTANPSEAAHKLCNQSPHFMTGEGQNRNLPQLNKPRAANPNLGPPKCDHISIEREECKTCPYLALHTTPLSVGFKIQRPNGHAFNFSPAAIPAGTQPIELPYRYYQDPVTFQVFKPGLTTASPAMGPG